MNVRRLSLSPKKKLSDAIPVQKSVKTVGKLVRRRKVSRPPKEAKRRNPRPKKSENSWVKTAGKLVRRRETSQSPVQKCQNSRKTREDEVCPPKEAKRRNPRPKKKESKQPANSWEDAKSLAPQKKPNDAKSARPKRASKQSANSREDAKSLVQKKESNEAIPVQKKIVKTGLQKTQSLSPPKRSLSTHPSVFQERCQNSHRQTLEKTQSLSTPKRSLLVAMQSPSKKGCQNSRQTLEKTQSLSPPKRSLANHRLNVKCTLNSNTSNLVKKTSLNGKVTRIIVFRPSVFQWLQIQASTQKFPEFPINLAANSPPKGRAFSPH